MAFWNAKDGILENGISYPVRKYVSKCLLSDDLPGSGFAPFLPFENASVKVDYLKTYISQLSCGVSAALPATAIYGNCLAFVKYTVGTLDEVRLLYVNVLDVRRGDMNSSASTVLKSCCPQLHRQQPNSVMADSISLFIICINVYVCPDLIYAKIRLLSKRR